MKIALWRLIFHVVSARWKRLRKTPGFGVNPQKHTSGPEGPAVGLA
jgi:hypothetical protein